MPGLQDLLNTLVSKITLVTGGGATPGALINAGLSPDPVQTGLVDAVSGLTRTTVLLKMLRFADSSLPDAGTSINDFLAIAGQVLGGQAMPQISVQMPGPALPGARIPVKQLSGSPGPNLFNGLNIAEDVPASVALPSQPSLGQDPGTDTTHDVLAGVPGIAGVIESGLATPTTLMVSLTWTFAVTNPDNSPGPTATLANTTLSALSLVPPVMFADLGSNPIFSMVITVTGSVYVPDPTAPTDPTKALFLANLPSVLTATVQFPGIPMPRFLGLFTWPLYGTEATSGDSNPDDSSLLLMFPADSPLTGVAAVTSAMNSVRGSVAPIVSLLSGPLSASTVTPFAPSAVVVGQLSALLTGFDSISNRLGVAAHGDYIPVTTLKAIAPSLNSPVRGGIRDLNGIWWDKETGGLDHDYYHDHAKSLLWVAPSGGTAVIYRDSGFSWDPSNAKDHGRLTLTTGGTCLAGISDFRPHPSIIDTALSPSLGVLTPATAVLNGFFTREHPPTSEDNWAWTDSMEFL
jgi:hypothetical protein